jgi:predicted nucleic acid-binding protein
MKAVQIFHERVVPLLTVEWITKPLHQAGLTAFLSANRRKLSLVDCTSFETMRQLNIDTAFAFDQHFVEQGFTCLT